MADVERLLLSKFFRCNRFQQDVCLRTIRSGEFLSYQREAEFVWTFAETHGKPPDATTFSSVFRSFEFVEAPEPLAYYVREVRGNTLRTQINARMGGLFKRIQAGDDVYDVAKDIRSVAEALDAEPTKMQDVISWQEDANAKIARYQQIAQGTGVFFRFPLLSLRRAVPRVSPGELLTLVAVPAVGKTFVMCWLAHYASVRMKLRVGLISREMPASDIRDRIDAIHLKLDWPKFVEGNLGLFDKARYFRHVRKIEQDSSAYCTIFGTDSRTFSMDDIYAAIVNNGLDMILVDGMHLIEAPGRDMVQQTYHRSRSFKQLLLATKCIGIQTLHAPSSAEDNEGKVTKAAGLGKSSWGAAASQDSDFYAEILAPRGKHDPERRIVVSKARNAPGGEATILMNMAPLSFEDCMNLLVYVDVDPMDG